MDQSCREIRLLKVIDPEDERHQHSGLIECDPSHVRLPDNDPDSIRDYLGTEESITQLIKDLKESNMSFTDLLESAAEDSDLQELELIPFLNILAGILQGFVLPDEFRTHYDDADKSCPTTHFFTALSYCWGESPERHEICVFKWVSIHGWDESACGSETISV